MSSLHTPLEAFREVFYPDTTDVDWNSWQWQMRHRITSTAEIKRFFPLTASEIEALERTDKPLPFGVTPYYAAVLHTASENQHLKKMVIPAMDEFSVGIGESRDPLSEEIYQPVKNIIHRYPERLIFLTTQNCAVYCRYCTRSRFAGHVDQPILPMDWQQGIAYIQSQKQVKEVILSGGDPFFLKDAEIDRLLSQLKEISHVKIIRLGTKIPVTLPQRVTTDLINVLKRYPPIYISLHVNHPAELTAPVTEALDRLIDGGCVIVSQTVLLKGINDQPEIMLELMESLLALRVRPYALFQCDLVSGSARFRAPVQKGLEIIRYLRQKSGGLAVPHYILDPPGGKVAVSPNNIIERNNEGYRLRNWEGKESFYPESRE